MIFNIVSQRQFRSVFHLTNSASAIYTQCGQSIAPAACWHLCELSIDPAGRLHERGATLPARNPGIYPAVRMTITRPADPEPDVGKYCADCIRIARKSESSVIYS